MRACMHEGDGEEGEQWCAQVLGASPMKLAGVLKVSEPPPCCTEDGEYWGGLEQLGLVGEQDGP